MAIETTSLNDLQFLRLKKREVIRIIPKELVENVKGRTFTTEQFFQYQEKNITNDFNFLYVILDPEKRVQGYLWAEMNCLDDSLFVNTFSISKEYWGKGEAIFTAVNFIKQLKTTIKASKIFWITTNEKFYIKHGFKRSKNVLMEFVT